MSDQKRKKNHEYDDGRTIANMDLDGMPGVIRRKDKTRKRQHRSAWSELNLTGKERRAMILGGIIAVLPWALLYALLFFLVMLFIDYVWLR